MRGLANTRASALLAVVAATALRGLRETPLRTAAASLPRGTVLATQLLRSRGCVAEATEPYEAVVKTMRPTPTWFLTVRQLSPVGQLTRFYY